MNISLCPIFFGLSKLIGIYWILLVVYALLSWLPGLRGRWSDYLAMIVEPVLFQFRRFIPPIGGFDIAFIVVLFVVRFVQYAIVPRECVLYVS